jgi:hypothetical protein
MGIYRGEVVEIMFALADIKADLRDLVQYFLEEDDGEEAEEDL